MPFPGGSRSRPSFARVAPSYKATGDIRAIQIFLGHSRNENTVRYLGVDIEDALILAEKTEI